MLVIFAMTEQENIDSFLQFGLLSDEDRSNYYECAVIFLKISQSPRMKIVSLENGSVGIVIVIGYGKRLVSDTSPKGECH
jgi:hypothetical protein